ncbi:hypothetical protein ACQPZP_08020 [Spirillospora sp. CA-142024]|uniref:hypothetical protein n=1 Tax=Spirillospora sp. CA-142024 TaxID=3240036 RepID=UPI003D8A89BB
MSGAVGRGIVAAGSIVLGGVTGAAINIATSEPVTAAVVGAVVLVLAWATVEGWRAYREHEPQSRSEPSREPESSDDSRPSGRSIDLQQDVETLSGANLTGARAVSPDASVKIRQKVKKAEGRSEIVGYDGRADG